MPQILTFSYVKTSFLLHSDRSIVMNWLNCSYTLGVETLTVSPPPHLLLLKESFLFISVTIKPFGLLSLY